MGNAVGICLQAKVLMSREKASRASNLPHLQHSTLPQVGKGAAASDLLLLWSFPSQSLSTMPLETSGIGA